MTFVAYIVRRSIKVICIDILKGQSKEEMFDLQFSSPFEPARATGQWVKISTIFVRISLSYSTLLYMKKLTPRSITL